MLSKVLIRSKLLEDPNWTPDVDYDMETLTEEDWEMFHEVHDQMKTNGELDGMHEIDLDDDDDDDMFDLDDDDDDELDDLEEDDLE